MGVFDSVIVPCPKCGADTEFQTKSGACVLACYTLANAPADVLVDVNRHIGYCENEGCQNRFSVTKEMILAAGRGSIEAPHCETCTCK